MKKRSIKPVRSLRASKSKKPVSKTVLFAISAAIVLLIITAGLQQPLHVTSRAQLAILTPPVPSLEPTISGPMFGCLGGNCPMQITPAISPITVSPGANAPVPGVSAAVPGVSAAPGAANPAEQPAGNPLEALENPNGKVPPGRAKNFLEQLLAFILQLLGIEENPQANDGPGKGDKPEKVNQEPGGQQQQPGGEEQDPEEENPQGDDPANGGGNEKPGMGNKPGEENPGGHLMQPGAAQKQVQEVPQGDEPQQGANAPQATNGGAVKQPANQPAQQGNPIQNLIKMLQQLFGGQGAAK